MRGWLTVCHFYVVTRYLLTATYIAYLSEMKMSTRKKSNVDLLLSSFIEDELDGDGGDWEPTAQTELDSEDVGISGLLQDWIECEGMLLNMINADDAGGLAGGDELDKDCSQLQASSNEVTLSDKLPVAQVSEGSRYREISSVSPLSSSSTSLTKPSTTPSHNTGADFRLNDVPATDNENFLNNSSEVHCNKSQNGKHPRNRMYSNADILSHPMNARKVNSDPREFLQNQEQTMSHYRPQYRPSAWNSQQRYPKQQYNFSDHRKAIHYYSNQQFNGRQSIRTNNQIYKNSYNYEGVLSGNNFLNVGSRGISNWHLRQEATMNNSSANVTGSGPLMKSNGYQMPMSFSNRVREGQHISDISFHRDSNGVTRTVSVDPVLQFETQNRLHSSNGHKNLALSQKYAPYWDRRNNMSIPSDDRNRLGKSSFAFGLAMQNGAIFDDLTVLPPSSAHDRYHGKRIAKRNSIYVANGEKMKKMRKNPLKKAFSN